MIAMTGRAVKGKQGTHDETPISLAGEFGKSGEFDKIMVLSSRMILSSFPRVAPSASFAP
jgi:hypothetical protein